MASAGAIRTAGGFNSGHVSSHLCAHQRALPASGQALLSRTVAPKTSNSSQNRNQHKVSILPIYAGLTKGDAR